MFNFRNDYSCVAHEEVLKLLLEASKEKNVGYGLDKHTFRAKELIKEKIDNIDVDIHFLVGGTQTNMVVISTVLKPYEAVIAVETGHINVHETGAIEGQGHKVLTVKGKDGKVLPEEVEKVVKSHPDMHMVKPKMVYISNSTEIGTVYTKQEIKELREVCDKYGLYLFMDGARLASALSSVECDLVYSDLPKLLDVFYIGGTKNGGYIGEALVIVKKELQDNFSYAVKHFGAMLAKGFVGAIVFEALMNGDLYLSIGKHENECAKILSDGLEKLGVKFYIKSSTNQIFPIFNNEVLKELSKICDYEIIEYIDNDNTCIRFVTGFETTKNECYDFIKEIEKIL